VRCEGGKSLLTYKGPVLPGLVKIRDELETVVADGEVLLAVLEQLGLHVWFRYEKFREEFSADDVVMAVDDTPVGTFVELEGGEAAIHATARALGKTLDDYITDSYRFLYLQHRDANGLAGHDMVFAGRADA
jgi:adenylate cyclase class 2